jgi:SAM-dependent methyltransferase
MNAYLSEEAEWHGTCIDIGGDKTSSYQGIIPLEKFDRMDTVNIVSESGANIIADASAIPVQDLSYDYALCLNVLEHVADPKAVLRELSRVLKADGTGILYIPFLVRVHPDPTDYQRLTPQGLERDILASGLECIFIRPASGGPFVAGFSQIHFMFPRWISLPLIWVAFKLDGVISRKRPKLAQAWPLGFYVRVKKGIHQ